jgi:hypothetical protein
MRAAGMPTGFTRARAAAGTISPLPRRAAAGWLRAS